jgi:uncharacterized protein
VTTTAPAKRFLRAEWQALAMLNYEVDPAALAPYVPAGTEIDGWGGRVYVSMVGFRFLRTRVLGLAIPLHRDFDEVNLRFYVRRYAPDGLRRGVAFVKEVVPRTATAWVARAVYGERYVALPMRHEVALPDPAQPGTGHASYGWRFGDAWQRLRVDVDGTAALPSLGSEAEFITEHYWGYARQRDGSTLEYRVEHPRWRVWRGAAGELECDVRAFYGERLAKALEQPPTSCFIAEGSEVTVTRGVRLAR